MSVKSGSREERKARVVEVLNQARAMELFAITQYMNQHYGLDSMDYGELAAKMKLIAIDEMRHAEMFAERVKELGGEPATSYEGDLKKLRRCGPFILMTPTWKTTPSMYTASFHRPVETMATPSAPNCLKPSSRKNRPT